MRTRGGGRIMRTRGGGRIMRTRGGGRRGKKTRFYMLEIVIKNDII